MERLESLPTSTSGRFQRIEANSPTTDVAHRLGLAGQFSDGEENRGRPLPSDVQARLRRVIGDDAPALRVHDDRAADAVARSHRADAVTYGQDVYFRQGEFRPDSDSGFGLLAHEATHVVASSLPGGRVTDEAHRDEEYVAHTNERLGFLDGVGAPATRSARQPDAGHRAPDLFDYAVTPSAWGQFVPPVLADPVAAPASPPMAAQTDRSVSAPPPVDLNALRLSVIQDLKRQLRTEFERGG